VLFLSSTATGSASLPGFKTLRRSDHEPASNVMHLVGNKLRKISIDIEFIYSFHKVVVLLTRDLPDFEQHDRQKLKLGRRGKRNALTSSTSDLK